jgi:hypothetical protein
MATVREFDEGGREAWQEWLESRPAKIREVAEKYPPWILYRIKGGSTCGIIASYGEQEDGSVTVTVDVTGEFNLVIMDRSVFGIKPSDLEECDIPDGLKGTALTEQPEIDAFCDVVRPGMTADRIARERSN